jgi:NAD(P)-dependent dehydrogenase (short-subunit alcohol dehydrogenase family)
VDILVNNAAEQHPREDITEIPSEQLERTFRTNVFGYFYMTQATLPHMPEGSAIINTTSVTAYRGSKHLLDYSATRGAVVALTRSLAQSLVDRNIRVNGVAPGYFRTAMTEAFYQDETWRDRMLSRIPVGRFVTPEEIAAAVVYLASDGAAAVTGHTLPVDGGVTVI